MNTNFDKADFVKNDTDGTLYLRLHEANRNFYYFVQLRDNDNFKRGTVLAAHDGSNDIKKIDACVEDFSTEQPKISKENDFSNAVIVDFDYDYTSLENFAGFDIRTLVKQTGLFSQFELEDVTSDGKAVFKFYDSSVSEDDLYEDRDKQNIKYVLRDKDGKGYRFCDKNGDNPENYLLKSDIKIGDDGNLITGQGLPSADENSKLTDDNLKGLNNGNNIFKHLLDTVDDDIKRESVLRGYPSKFKIKKLTADGRVIFSFLNYKGNEKYISEEKRPESGTVDLVQGKRDVYFCNYRFCDAEGNNLGNYLLKSEVKIARNGKLITGQGSYKPDENDKLTEDDLKKLNHGNSIFANEISKKNYACDGLTIKFNFEKFMPDGSGIFSFLNEEGNKKYIVKKKSGNDDSYQFCDENGDNPGNYLLKSDINIADNGNLIIGKGSPNFDENNKLTDDYLKNLHVSSDAYEFENELNDGPFRSEIKKYKKNVTELRYVGLNLSGEGIFSFKGNNEKYIYILRSKDGESYRFCDSSGDNIGNYLLKSETKIMDNGKLMAGTGSPKADNEENLVDDNFFALLGLSDELVITEKIPGVSKISGGELSEFEFDKFSSDHMAIFSFLDEEGNERYILRDKNGIGYRFCDANGDNPGNYLLKSEVKIAGNGKLIVGKGSPDPDEVNKLTDDDLKKYKYIGEKIDKAIKEEIDYYKGIPNGENSGFSYLGFSVGGDLIFSFYDEKGDERYILRNKDGVSYRLCNKYGGDVGNYLLKSEVKIADNGNLIIGEGAPNPDENDKLTDDDLKKLNGSDFSKTEINNDVDKLTKIIMVLSNGFEFKKLDNGKTVFEFYDEDEGQKYILRDEGGKSYRFCDEDGNNLGNYLLKSEVKVGENGVLETGYGDENPDGSDKLTDDDFKELKGNGFFINRINKAINKIKERDKGILTAFTLEEVTDSGEAIFRFTVNEDNIYVLRDKDGKSYRFCDVSGGNLGNYLLESEVKIAGNENLITGEGASNPGEGAKLTDGSFKKLFGDDNVFSEQIEEATSDIEDLKAKGKFAKFRFEKELENGDKVFSCLSGDSKIYILRTENISGASGSPAIFYRLCDDSSFKVTGDNKFLKKECLKEDGTIDIEKIGKSDEGDNLGDNDLEELKDQLRLSNRKVEFSVATDAKLDKEYDKISDEIGKIKGLEIVVKQYNETNDKARHYLIGEDFSFYAFGNDRDSNRVVEEKLKITDFNKNGMFETEKVVDEGDGKLTFEQLRKMKLIGKDLFTYKILNVSKNDDTGLKISFQKPGADVEKPIILFLKYDDYGFYSDSNYSNGVKIDLENVNISAGNSKLNDSNDESMKKIKAELEDKGYVYYKIIEDLVEKKGEDALKINNKPIEGYIFKLQDPYDKKIFKYVYLVSDNIDIAKKGDLLLMSDENTLDTDNSNPKFVKFDGLEIKPEGKTGDGIYSDDDFILKGTLKAIKEKALSSVNEFKLKFELASFIDNKAELKINIGGVKFDSPKLQDGSDLPGKKLYVLKNTTELVDENNNRYKFDSNGSVSKLDENEIYLLKDLKNGIAAELNFDNKNLLVEDDNMPKPTELIYGKVSLASNKKRVRIAMGNQDVEVDFDKYGNVFDADGNKKKLILASKDNDSPKVVELDSNENFSIRDFVDCNNGDDHEKKENKAINEFQAWFDKAFENYLKPYDFEVDKKLIDIDDDNSDLKGEKLVLVTIKNKIEKPVKLLVLVPSGKIYKDPINPADRKKINSNSQRCKLEINLVKDVIELENDKNGSLDFSAISGPDFELKKAIAKEFCHEFEKENSIVISEGAGHKLLAFKYGMRDIEVGVDEFGHLVSKFYKGRRHQFIKYENGIISIVDENENQATNVRDLKWMKDKIYDLNLFDKFVIGYRKIGVPSKKDKDLKLNLNSMGEAIIRLTDASGVSRDLCVFPGTNGLEIKSNGNRVGIKDNKFVTIGDGGKEINAKELDVLLPFGNEFINTKLENAIKYLIVDKQERTRFGFDTSDKFVLDDFEVKKASDPNYLEVTFYQKKNDLISVKRKIWIDKHKKAYEYNKLDEELMFSFDESKGIMFSDSGKGILDFIRDKFNINDNDSKYQKISGFEGDKEKPVYKMKKLESKFIIENVRSDTGKVGGKDSVDGVVFEIKDAENKIVKVFSPGDDNDDALYNEEGIKVRLDETKGEVVEIEKGEPEEKNSRLLSSDLLLEALLKANVITQAVGFEIDPESVRNIELNGEENIAIEKENGESEDFKPNVKRKIVKMKVNNKYTWVDLFTLKETDEKGEIKPDAGKIDASKVGKPFIKVDGVVYDLRKFSMAEKMGYICQCIIDNKQYKDLFETNDATEIFLQTIFDHKETKNIIDGYNKFVEDNKLFNKDGILDVDEAKKIFGEKFYIRTDTGYVPLSIGSLTGVGAVTLATLIFSGAVVFPLAMPILATLSSVSAIGFTFFGVDLFLTKKNESEYKLPMEKLKEFKKKISVLSRVKNKPTKKKKKKDNQTKEKN